MDLAVVIGTASSGAGAAGGATWWGITGTGLTAVVAYLLGVTGAALGTPVELVLAGVRRAGGDVAVAGRVDDG